jgi:hypothetical protein
MNGQGEEHKGVELKRRTETLDSPVNTHPPSQYDPKLERSKQFGCPKSAKAMNREERASDRNPECLPKI